MFYIIQAAGWPIWLLLIASVIALALIIERLWYLRRSRILPAGLLEQTIRDYREGRIDNKTIAWLEGNSPLGAVLATGLQHSDVSRDNMREAMEETGRSVALQMERFLTTIGTDCHSGTIDGAFRNGSRHDRDFRFAKCDWNESGSAGSRHFRRLV